MAKVLTAIVLGAALGIAAAHILFLQWFTLVPWGVGGVALGLWMNTTSEAAITGALYGFALTFSFMAAGYTGKPSLISRFPSFALLGLFGAACGVVLTWIGSFARRNRG